MDFSINLPNFPLQKNRAQNESHEIHVPFHDLISDRLYEVENTLSPNRLKLYVSKEAAHHDSSKYLLEKVVDIDFYLSFFLLPPCPLTHLLCDSCYHIELAFDELIVEESAHHFAFVLPFIELAHDKAITNHHLDALKVGSTFFYIAALLLSLNKL